MSKTIDVLAVMDRGTGLARTMAGLSADHIAKRNLAEMGAARDAVAELIAACKARDSAGYRPSWSDIAVDCSGHLSTQAAHYDAAQARYFAALAACGAAQ